jgi:hypothetical protein
MFDGAAPFLPERDWRGRFVHRWYVDPFDPTFWEEDLPYRRLYLSDRDEDKWCLVDAIDYDWAQQWKWVWDPNSWGKPYASRSESRVKLWLHKELLRRFAGPPPSPEHTIGDHMSGWSRDCRRRNLRWATVQENNANRLGLYFRQYQLGFDGMDLSTSGAVVR